jgi:hypothetical protein
MASERKRMRYSQGTLAAIDDAETLTPMGDTIRMPWMADAESGEIVVRPTLAILFRLALGTAAEGYATRFMRYERTGHGGVRWHWPALFFPAAWAFYRKLWWSGLAFAVLPFACAALFAWLDPAFGESALVWLACAFAMVWLLPAVAASLLADSLLYRRIRRRVREAEAASEQTDEVAAILCAKRPTALWAALLFGGASLLLLAEATVPDLRVLYGQHVIRSQVAAGLAAVAPLLRQVEDSWQRSASIPRRPDYAAVQAHRGATFLDAVDLSPTNGRVRLVLGSALGELSGKALLLAPAVDARQRIRWYCIAVDAPQRYLPQDCRNV